MQCPYCGNFDERVLRSREDIKSNTIVRKRICLYCGAQLATVEKIDQRSTRQLNKRRKWPDE
jgi:transcriptional repressor NrdR